MSNPWTEDDDEWPGDAGGEGAQAARRAATPVLTARDKERAFRDHAAPAGTAAS